MRILSRVQRADHPSFNFVGRSDYPEVGRGRVGLNVVDAIAEHLCCDFLAFRRVLERTGESSCDRGVRVNRLHSGLERVEVSIEWRNRDSPDKADFSRLADLGAKDAGQVAPEVVVVGDRNDIGNWRIHRVTEELNPFRLRIVWRYGLKGFCNLVECRHDNACTRISERPENGLVCCRVLSVDGSILKALFVCQQFQFGDHRIHGARISGSLRVDQRDQTRGRSGRGWYQAGCQHGCPRATLHETAATCGQLDLLRSMSWFDLHCLFLLAELLTDLCSDLIVASSRVSARLLSNRRTTRHRANTGQDS